MEHPGAAVVIAPLAAAVGYSRVHTGVHWPTDVAAGAAIGVGAAYATAPLVAAPEGPAGRSASAATPPPSWVTAKGSCSSSTPAPGRRETSSTEVGKAWPSADIIELQPDVDVIAEVTKRVEHGDVRAVGAVGGDGTVACVAGVAVEHGLPLVLVPAGTLNHFARDVGIDNLDEAQAATRAGSVILCDVAEVAIDRSGDDDGRLRQHREPRRLPGDRADAGEAAGPLAQVGGGAARHHPHTSPRASR